MGAEARENAGSGIVVAGGRERVTSLDVIYKVPTERTDQGNFTMVQNLPLSLLR